MSLLQQLTGKIAAPILERIFAALSLFVQDSWELRKIQALNAARSKYDFAATLTAPAGAPTYTPRIGPNTGVATAGAFLFDQAQQSDQTFSYALITTDRFSGAAYYFMSGNNPTAGTGVANSSIGFPLQAAGDQVIIHGHENIKAFRLVAEGGATVYVTASLFM